MKNIIEKILNKNQEKRLNSEELAKQISNELLNVPCEKCNSKDIVLSLLDREYNCIDCDHRWKIII